MLDRVTCAPITRTIRGIRFEVDVGIDEGLPAPSVISGDNVVTISPAVLDPEAIGRLDDTMRAALDRVLRYALDIRC